MAESGFTFLKVTAKPYSIPDDLARELAAIIIEWGGLENAITVDLEQLRMWEIVRKLTDVLPGGFGAKLKLWRRSIAALYPTINLYNDVADGVVAAAKTVGIHRHRIIHGLWRPDETNPSEFYVLTAIDRRKDPAYFKADVKFLTALHEDIRKICAQVWSLNLTRQTHAVRGLLQRQPGPSGEHLVLRTLPTPETL